MTDEGGRLFDTYVASLQHGHGDLPVGVVRLGVVRRPTPWFNAETDENKPALGPPPELLDEFHDRRAELQATGLDDACAHNQAATEISFDERYRTYLQNEPEPKQALQEVRGRLAARTDVALVCYEDTDEKRCHRTVLRDYLETKGCV